MELELLVVPDCPHEGPALAAFRSAAELAGVDTGRLAVTVIESEEDARRRVFTGSPTFLINGVDPFAAPGAPVAMACRVYPTARGLAGVPEAALLQNALRTA